MTISSADIAATGIAAQKKDLRLEMKARRALLNESDRARAAWILNDLLGDWLRAHAATRAATHDKTRVAIYLARPSEISLDALASELIQRDAIVCAPRVDVENTRMSFHRLADLDATTRGPWGVREPPDGELVRPEIALVPGLAFDQNGGRLGTGGGWYDRVLAEIPVKIGVCFGEQIVAKVPIEAHDIQMNWLASDAGLQPIS